MSGTFARQQFHVKDPGQPRCRRFPGIRQMTFATCDRRKNSAPVPPRCVKQRFDARKLARNVVELGGGLVMQPRGESGILRAGTNVTADAGP
jgi:hypothetical protein